MIYSIQIPSEDYENSSKYYDFILNPFINHIRKAVANWVIKNQPENILDIGCGTGKQISLLPKDMNIIGIDLSSAMLKIADKQAPGKCMQGDAVNLPFEDDKFDLIISQFALHEKDTDTINMELKEVSRLLKPNGKFLIVDFDHPRKLTYYAKFLRWGIRMIEQKAGDEHFTNYKIWMTRGGLKKIISEYGWKNIENYEFYRGNVQVIIMEKE